MNCDIIVVVIIIRILHSPNRGCGAAVHLPIQDDLVLLQLQDDLVNAADHAVDPLGQTLASLGLLQRLLLATHGQLLLDLLQILRHTHRHSAVFTQMLLCGR